MNLGELRDLARTKLDDKVEPYLWSDEFLNAAINRAQDEAIVRIGGIADDYTPQMTHQTAVAGSPIVVVAPNVMKVESVATKNGLLQPVTAATLAVSNPAWEADTGVPIKYIIGANSFRLYPTPVDDTVLTMHVRRGALTPLVADAQKPEVPYSLHAPLLHWVLAEAYDLPDADISNPGASDKHQKAFEGVFGPRPSAKFLNTWNRTPARSAALMRRL